MQVDDDVAARQHDVQRKLGRCMLRLQQVELLAKALHMGHVVEGPASQLQAIHEQRVADMATRSLGQVGRALSESYLTTPPPAGAEDEFQVVIRESSRKEAWFQTRAYVSLSEAQLEQTRKELDDFVKMRNRLVHHFIEHFNVWTSDGCDAADSNLGRAYAQIDAQHLTLRRWAEGMDNARLMMGNFLASPRGSGDDPAGAQRTRPIHLRHEHHRAATPGNRARMRIRWLDAARYGTRHPS